MKQKIANVEQWFADRGIIENSTPLKQALKTSEEVLELQNAIIDNDLEEIKDAIGDIQVTLIGICLQLGLDFYNDVATDFNELKKTLDSTDAFDLSHSIEEYITYFKICFYKQTNIEQLTYITCLKFVLIQLQTIGETYNLTLEQCLQSAYDVIKKRKGKMINGQFVKN